jgi:hypothetical protein
MFTPRNPIIDASPSGKMGKPHLKLFLQDKFFAYACHKLSLFIDSWSVYYNNTILESIQPEEKLLEMLTIPPANI